ncbi:MAG: MFS transporter [bacterium]
MDDTLGSKPQIEPATIATLRRRLLPFLFLLYVVAFLDRINIGFAALTMNRELGVSTQQFGFLVGVFFFGYFLLEIPSNLLLHKLGARVWIARIMLTWGVVAIASGFVRSVDQLYVARFLLGVAEAGFFPGIILYLTYWFPKRERARAIALFMIAQPVTSILGGPLSGVILDRVHWMGVGSWRWLLILEGFPALVGGVLTYALLPNGPAEARYLTEGEKLAIATELASEQREASGARELSVSLALRHRGVWHLAAVGILQAVGLYTLSFWTPQVIKALSSVYTNTIVGLLVTIPNVAGLFAMLLVAHRSDRVRERRQHIAIPLTVGGMAFIALASSRSPISSIALLSLVAFGAYGFFGPFFASVSGLLGGIAGATTIALVTSVSNLGGFVGPYLVGLIARRTGNLNGGLVLAGCSMILSAALALFLPRRTHVT